MLASIITAIAVTALVILAIRSYIKQRKKGCGGNCMYCHFKCTDKDK